jgi:hypothetical protein
MLFETQTSTGGVRAEAAQLTAVVGNNYRFSRLCHNGLQGSGISSSRVFLPGESTAFMSLSMVGSFVGSSEIKFIANNGDVYSGVVTQNANVNLVKQ